MSKDSFDARDTLEVSGAEYEIYRLDALQSEFDVARVPYSIKVLLENALRLEGRGVGHARARGGDREAGMRAPSRARRSRSSPPGC